MTERERICEQPPQGAITRPFVRLEIRFRDGALYCPRWPIDDEHAPQWRGTYASSSPFMWAIKFSIKWREFGSWPLSVICRRRTVANRFRTLWSNATTKAAEAISRTMAKSRNSSELSGVSLATYEPHDVLPWGFV
jgi:hypothetical protein